MIQETLRRPSAVLVAESRCQGRVPKLTKAETSDGETVFIVVSLIHGTEEKVSILERCHGQTPNEVHVISAMKTQPEASGVDSVSEVGLPSDLTKLSMRINSVLRDTEREDAYLYFDNLTCLLQYTETGKASRFLRSLIGELHSTDCVGYFGIVPEAHDEQTYATIESLFDHIDKR